MSWCPFSAHIWSTYGFWAGDKMLRFTAGIFFTIKNWTSIWSNSKDRRNSYSPRSRVDGQQDSDLARKGRKKIKKSLWGWLLEDLEYNITPRVLINFKTWHFKKSIFCNEQRNKFYFEKYFWSELKRSLRDRQWVGKKRLTRGISISLRVYLFFNEVK